MMVGRGVRVFLVAVVTLTACKPVNDASFDPPGTAIVHVSPTPAPAATESLVVVILPTPTPSSPPALPSPTPRATTPPTSAPITPSPPSSPAPTVGPARTPSGTPAQTRVPNSSAIPSPQGLPASDGCLTYGAQPPFISFVDCVVHGLQPGAPVTLTANGEVVFLRIGRTDVYPDGTFYFAWSETVHKEIVFVVTAAGVSRTITQVFR